MHACCVHCINTTSPHSMSNKHAVHQQAYRAQRKAGVAPRAKRSRADMDALLAATPAEQALWDKHTRDSVRKARKRRKTEPTSHDAPPPAAPVAAASVVPARVRALTPPPVVVAPAAPSPPHTPSPPHPPPHAVAIGGFSSPLASLDPMATPPLASIPMSIDPVATLDLPPPASPS